MLTGDSAIASGGGLGAVELDSALLATADRLADEVAREHRFQHVAIFLFDPSVERLRLVGQRWGAGEDRGVVKVGEWLVDLGGVCGRVFRTGEPALVPDVRLDPDYRTFPGSRTRSELAVPLVVGGRTIGVVNVESPRVGEYGVHELEALRAWAGIVAPAVAGHWPRPGD